MNKAMLAVVMSMVLAGAGRAAEVAGYVLDVEGSWQAQGADAPLAVGAAVPAGAVLMPPAQATSGRLVVLAAGSGAVLVQAACSAAAPCTKPVSVPGGGAGFAASGGLSGLLDRVVARLAGEPDRYVANLSRSLVLLHDAVLQTEQGRVDLGPLFAALPAARYEIVLSRFNCSASRPCAPMPLTFRYAWSSDDPRSPLVAGLEPGLYDLSARAEGGKLQARGWVLLVPPSELVGTARRYSDALRVVDGWGTRVDPATKRSFARAALDALSER